MITESEKEKELSTLLYSVKILAILFSVIPIFQILFKGEPVKLLLQNIQTQAILTSLVVLMLILVLIVLISYEDKFNQKIASHIEITLFFILFGISIYISGKNASYYKFLFLFIIIYSSIKYALKVGLCVATCSSVIIFAYDVIFTSTSETNIYIENDVALASMFFTVAIIIGRYSKLQSRHIEVLKENANTDGLTGIYNHRCFYDNLNFECKNAITKNLPISIAIIDIDKFKIYNDIYGHQQGDQLLCELVDVIKTALNGEFTLYRYGGEEFSIIFPNVKLGVAMKTAEEVRAAVENSRFYGEEVLPHKTLTVSIGVAEFDDEVGISDVVRRADSALFRAKHLKRNCVEVYASILEEYSLANFGEYCGHLNMKAIDGMFRVIKSKDVYTFNHMERVANYCDIYSKYYQLSDKNRKTLIVSAYLHDIGKIKIDSEILKTAKKLSDSQWKELTHHPEYSSMIISKIGGNQEIIDIVKQHHEKIDGSGYPDHLKGDEIKYLAKIISVADSFDAMTNNRPYNKKMTYDEAFDELRKCSGTQFDPDIAEKFINSFKVSDYYTE